MLICPLARSRLADWPFQRRIEHGHQRLTHRAGRIECPCFDHRFDHAAIHGGEIDTFAEVESPEQTLPRDGDRIHRLGADG
jgi:hypothetical protein